MQYKNNKRLLVNEEICLITQPEVALTLGKSEAIFLQQLHYWLTTDKDIGHISDGQKWIYNSYKSWVENIKIFSESTVRRAVKKLEEAGIILTKNMNKKKSDHTKWYTINYEVLQDLIPGIFNRKENRVEESKANKRLFKMNSPCVQNEHIINKETEITSENKSLPTEGKEGKSKELVKTQQVYVVKKEPEIVSKNLENKSSENQNNLVLELLEIWNQTVGKGGATIQLNKKRAQYLAAAFKYRFESNLTKWKQFCHQITTSDFLMGRIKSAFKASLDWVLRFDIIQRILEGDFGVRDNLINHYPINEETISREVEEKSESKKAKSFRLSVLSSLGGALYNAWFADLSITEMEEERGVVLIAKTRFISHWIETHYLDELQSLTRQIVQVSCATG